MAKRKLDPIAAFNALSATEKEKVFESFEPGWVQPEGKPLTAAERAQWERGKRGRGRPVKGEGAEPIAVTVERGLLRRTDAHAERLGVSRARLIAMALENILPDASTTTPGRKSRTMALSR